ncbi:MAG: nuclear transport factor 2 family protein [Bacteroidota bacterium]
MNPTLSVIYSVLLLFLAIHLTAQTPADEYMAISETLSNYLDGGTQNDFNRLKKAFHSDATMKFVGEEYKAVNALEFFGNAMKPGLPTNRQTRIVSIHQNGLAANAILQIDYPDTRLTDFMNLLKIDGEWKIISKIFYGEKTNTANAKEKPLTRAEKEVLSVLHRWKMAYINRNAVPLETILADHWTYSGNSNGQLGRKETTIEGTKNAKGQFLAANFKNLQTQKIGDVVIVKGQEELITEEGGKTSSGWLMFTDIFQKIDGKWRAIATHSSPINASDK